MIISILDVCCSLTTEAFCGVFGLLLIELFFLSHSLHFPPVFTVDFVY